MTPTDFPDQYAIDRTRSELNEGLETSREMVRQSRILLELSEADPAFADDMADADD